MANREPADSVPIRYLQKKENIMWPIRRHATFIRRRTLFIRR
ncbi:hypothetical protein [Bacillus sp. SD088]|nr:hypothetical protein [Bacillus sp. SD088]